MFALDKLEIETNLRKLVIIATKAQIKTDLEALDQEMVEIGRLTFSAETTLMNAKRLTASKKLEVIPYIEIILQKQQELVDGFTDNADKKQALISAKEALIEKKEDLIEAKQGIADKFTDLISAREDLLAAKEETSAAQALLLAQETKTMQQWTILGDALTRMNEAHQRLIAAKKELIPFLNAKSTALLTYSGEVTAWILVKETIAGVKEEIAALKTIEGDNKSLIMAERKILDGLELALQEARLDLQVAKLAGHKTITETRMSELGEILTKEETVFTREQSEESTMRSARIEADEYLERKIFTTKREVDDILIPMEKQMISRVALSRIQELEATSDIAAQAKLTSELIHLIG